MDTPIISCELQDATTTQCGFTVEGWSVAEWSIELGFFLGIVGIFLGAVFIGLHFTRK